MKHYPWRRWLNSLSSLGTRPARRRSQRTPLSLEELENRITPQAVTSTLPPALVSNQQMIGTQTVNGSAISPQVAIDPLNPEKMVVAASNMDRLLLYYSTDGGSNWTNLFNQPNSNFPTNSNVEYQANPFPNLDDPNANPENNNGGYNNALVTFTLVTGVSVTFDRTESFYVLETQSDATLSSGALVLQKFDMSGAVSANVPPTQTITNEPLYTWLDPSTSGKDAIYNSIIAVDNNVASFTDPQTGAVQTDPLAQLVPNPITGGAPTAADPSGLVPKGVYVAWNTNDTTPNGVGGFKPNQILAVVSNDGGTTWTAPQFVSNGDYFTANEASPQIVFTQGTASGSLPGGELMFVWNEISNGNGIENAISQPTVSPTSNNNPAAIATTYTSQGPFPIFQPASGSGVAVTNTYSITVTNDLTLTFPGAAEAETYSYAGGLGSVFNYDPLNPPTQLQFQTFLQTVAGLTAPGSVTVAGPTGGPFVVTFAGNLAPQKFTETTGTATLVQGDNIFGNNNLDENMSVLDTLTVSLSIQYPNLPGLTATLISPTGKTATLFLNGVNTAGTAVNANNSFPAGANLGVLNGYSLLNDPNPRSVLFANPSGNEFGSPSGVATVFDDNAALSYSDKNAAAPYIGRFAPQGSLSFTFGGLTRSQMIGNWRLRIVVETNDGVNNPNALQIPELDSWALNLTGETVDAKGNLYGNFQPTSFGFPPSFGTNNFIIGAANNVFGDALVGAFNNMYPARLNGGGAIPSATQTSIGPSVSVAVDNTLGSFSPHQGRIYLAYTGLGINATIGTLDDTDVYLIASDDGGVTWTALPSNPVVFGLNVTRINDDSPTDNFSQGNRTQFGDVIAVDQSTGTLVAEWYDGRYDPSRVRVAEYLSDSIDGGQTFSTNVFVSPAKTATDVITGNTDTLEPIPGNQGQAGARGFGDRQSLAVFDGKVYPFFSSNFNGPLVGQEYNTGLVTDNPTGIFTASVTIASGPRIIRSDMGPILSDGSTGTYNNTFSADGTRQFTGFTVTFDRPVDPATFTPNLVTLKYQDPTSSSSSYVDLSNQITGIVPLDVDQTPTLNVGNGIVERTAAGTFIQFPVVLSQPQTSPTTVEYTLGGPNDTALAGIDYVAPNGGIGTVVIPPGQLTAVITVPILGNAAIQADQKFTINISAPSTNFNIVGPNARVTFTTVFGNVNFAYNGVAAPSPLFYFSGFTSAAQFQAFLQTIPTLSAPGDVVNVTGPTGGPFNVTLGNGLSALGLTAVTPGSATVTATGPGLATGTLVNPTAGTPSISVGDAILPKGFYGSTNAVFPIVLSSPATGTESVQWTTVDGTATAARGDYQAASGTVTFAAGQSVAFISVAVNGNSTPAPGGTLAFGVQLSNAVGLTLDKTTGTGTIVDQSGKTGATEFLVQVNPQSKVGTYSYSIQPFVRDRIRSESPNGTDPFNINPVTFTGVPANLVPGTEAVVSFDGTGNVLLEFNGALAPNPLAYSAATTAAQFQAYLSTIPGLTAPGSILSVTGPNGGPFTVALNANLNAAGLLSVSGPAVVNVTGIVGTFPAPANQVNLTIPKASVSGGFLIGSVTSSTLAMSGIPAGQVISDLTVNLTLNHAIPQNLEMFLIAPDGFTFTLLTQPTVILPTPTTPSSGFFDTTFDDTATVSIANGTPPYTGRFRPATPLSVLDGQDPNNLGNFSAWTLQIDNFDPNNAGKLINWSITVQTATPVDTPPGSSLGNYMDQNQDASGGEVIRASNDIYSVPAPINGVPFQLPYSASTLPLIIPGPHPVDPTYAATATTVTFTAYTGSVSFAYNGQQAAASFSFNYATSSAAQLQAYLSSIPGLTTPGAVNVTGPLGGPFAVSLASGLDPALLTVASGPAQLTLQGSNQLNQAIQPAATYPTSSLVFNFAAAGTVSLAFNGVQAPNPLNYTAATTAAQFQTYLATIPGLTGPGAVTATGPVGGPYTVTLGPGLATNALTVITAPLLVSFPAAGPVSMAFNGVQAAVPLNYTATTTATQLQNYLATITGLTGPGAVTATGPAGGPYIVTLGPNLNSSALTVFSGPDLVSFSGPGNVFMAYNGSQPFFPLAYTAATTAAQFQAFLQTIPLLSLPGAVASVTGNNGGPFTVTLGPGLTSSGLTVLFGPAAVATPQVTGPLSLPGTDLLTFFSNISTVTLAYNGTTAPGTFSYNANTTTAAQVQTYLATIPGLPTTGLSVTGPTGGPFNIAFGSGGNAALLTAAAGPITVTPETTTTPSTLNSYITISGVPTGYVLTHLAVTVNLTEENDAGLQLTLISSDGTKIPLVNSGTASGANFWSTTFDDNAVNTLAAGVGPYQGSFQPASPLIALQGKSINGTWTLQITNSTPGALDNSGILKGWSMTVQTGEVLNNSSSSIDVTFDRDIQASSFTPANVLTMISPFGAIPTSSIVITPDPAGTPVADANRTFRISGFPTQTISGTYTATVGPDNSGNYIKDVNGNRVDTNFNAGVDLLRGGNPNNGTILAQPPFVSLGANNNVVLPAGQTATSTITVPNAFLVQGVSVTLNILHGNDPDLTAFLVAPDGTAVELFSGAGTSGSAPHANFTNATFSDSATLPIQLAATLPGGIGISGTFNPQFPLSAFKGHGSAGNWTLVISSKSSVLGGTLQNWSLTLSEAVPGSGLGEPVADRFSQSFRIFVQDPTLAPSQTAWTGVGPASINAVTPSGIAGVPGTVLPQGASGRVSAIAVDPSDPSGNTVFVGGASGGVWETKDFLTTDPAGPTYVPLTNTGPGNSLNIGAIAVYPGTNPVTGLPDPNYSIIFAATGEGNTGTPGVGILRSEDGGKTWRILDSRTNIDNNVGLSSDAHVLPMNDPGRDHAFLNQSAFKVLIDPKREADGNLYVYVAFGGAANQGVWRSSDTGGHWTLIKAGDATDLAFANNSVDASGFTQILFAGIAGSGVFMTTSAPTATTMTAINGGAGVALRRDMDGATPANTAIPIASNPGPGGANGRIALATPAKTGNPLQDELYEGWIYAVVVTAGKVGVSFTAGGGSLVGLYLSKDFGQNWTQIQLPVTGPGNGGVPTNNNSAANYDPVGNKASLIEQGNYDLTLAVDPNNPNISYVGGSDDVGPYGMIRVDATMVEDPYNLTAFSNSKNDGGATQNNSVGSVSVKALNNNAVPPVGWSYPYGLEGPGQLNLIQFNFTQPLPSLLNLLTDPRNPFLTNSTLLFTNVLQFNNTGQEARWMPFNDPTMLGGSTDQHALVVMKDPLTGKTRLLFGDDQGIWTGVDNGDGSLNTGIGSLSTVTGSRNGNIQITQMYQTAAQPSILAADLAGALFYGMAQDDGFPQSNPNLLSTGNLSWTGITGDGSGVATDQTGSGTVYQYKWPCCINDFISLGTDFFQITLPGGNTVSRTTGLVQAGDNPAKNVGQWPLLGIGYGPGDVAESRAAVNPIDPSAIVISSSVGRIFRTSGPSTGTGRQWFDIADPTDLDSSYGSALAWGAPSAPGNVPLDDFIYVGTLKGNVFVTFNGGGAGGGAAAWKNITGTGLDGSSIMQIVPDTVRGSHDLYAVTQNGVYYLADSTVANPVWQNLTGNLFSANLTRPLFNDPSLAPAASLAAGTLTSIAVDWRFAIPNPNGVNTPTGNHPVLYVAGSGGVFRSFDMGQNWTYFPNQATDGAAQDGGYFPSVGVSSLQLVLGNLNPADGTPNQPTGLNMLLAGTYGQGAYAIRLNPNVLVNGKTLASYAISPVDGPHVVNITTAGPSSTGAQDMVGIQVTFSGTVDPTTFTATLNLGKIIGVTGPNGQSIPVAQVADITPSPGPGLPNPHNVYELVFFTPQSTPGFYSVSLGPNISDYSGNKMDQNQNGINGETPGDVYSGRFLFQPWQNSAPVLGTTTALVVPSQLEITAPAAAGLGETVAAFINSLIASGGYNDPDSSPNAGPPANNGYAPANAPAGIAITSVNNSNGTWQYSRDGGNTWTNIVGVSSTTALLLEANNTNRIRFLPNVFFFGSASFTFRGWDETSGLSLINGADGLTGDTTVNGGTTAFSSTVATASVTINFVNRAPSFAFGPNPNQTILENTAGQQTVAGLATNITADSSAPPATDHNFESVNFLVSNSNPSLFASQPAISPSGTLTYTLAANVSGTATVMVQAHNNGGQGFTLTGPTLATLFTLSFNGSAPSSPIAWTGNPVSDAAAIQAALAALPTVGGIGGTVTVTADPTDTDFALVFGGALAALPTPAVQVTVTASSATASNYGSDTSGTQTFTITVLHVNRAPSFTLPSPTAAVLENTAGQQSLAGWATNVSSDSFVPPAADQFNETVSFLVTSSNPAMFTATGQPAIVFVPGSGPGGWPGTGTLTYTLAPNVSGTVQISVQAKDSGPNATTANGGVVLSAPQTFTLTIDHVNRAPSFTLPNATANVNEESGAQSFGNWATGISPDTGSPAAADQQNQTVNFIVTTNNPTLFAVQPALSPAGTLTFTPAPDQFGTAMATVQAVNNGGFTLNGAVANTTQFLLTFNGATTLVPITWTGNPVTDTAAIQSALNGLSTIAPGSSVTVTTDPTDTVFNIAFNGSLAGTSQPVNAIITQSSATATPYPAQTTTQTFTINVAFVKDTPSFTVSPNPDQVVLENSTSNPSTPTSVPNWAVRVSPDDQFPTAADESNEQVRFLVSNNNNSLFTLTGQPAIIPNGSNGTLTYTLAQYTSGVATVTVQEQTAGGFTLIGPGMATQFTVSFNGSAPSAPISWTGDPLADAQSVQNALNTLPTISGLGTVIVKANQADTNFNVLFQGSLAGTALPVNVKVTASPAIASSYGLAVSPTQTFTITVNHVNRPPSFTAGAPESVQENSGQHTVANWATQVSPDSFLPPAADQINQTVQFLVSTTNSGLFTVPPAITVNQSAPGVWPATGTLTYTLAPNVSGTATVTVVLASNGNTFFGGSSTSAAQQFTITVNHVNRPPTFTAGLNQLVKENASPVTVTNWASNVSSDSFLPPAADQVNESVNFVVSNSNPALFAPGGAPAITVVQSAPGIWPATGTLTYAPAANAFGSDTVTVQLQSNGDTSHGGTNLSPPQTFIIQVLGGTITTVSSSTSPGATAASSVFGQSVTFTATVSPLPLSVGPASPTGTVDFFDASTLKDLGTQPLNGNQAILNTSSLAVGNHNIVVTYSGDSNFQSSSDNLLVQTVNPDPTTTTVLPSASPTAYGQQVTYTATVTANGPGSGIPTGQVNFLEGTTVLGTGTLNNGVATFSTTSLAQPLAVGGHTITASYVGDGNFGSSSGQTGNNVQAANTTTGPVSFSPSSNLVSGQTLTLTAKVTANFPGTGIPGGTVFFYDGSTFLDKANLDTQGVATITTSALKKGNHNLTATYNATTNYNTSTSAPVAVSIAPDDTTTGLTLNATLFPLVLGEPITFTATVSPNFPGSGIATGTMTFMDGGTNLTPNGVTLVNGVATFITSSLSLGSHSITASYAGDGNYNGSTSSTQAFAINPVVTTTTISPIGSLTALQPVLLTATVSVNSPGVAALAAGTLVTFSDNGQPIGSPVAINASGVAKLQTNGLPAGNNVITASYAGDTNHQPSTGQTTVFVSQDTTTTALTFSTNPVGIPPGTIVFGQTTVTYKATVTASSPSTGIPTGTVIFQDGATQIGTGTLDAQGNATFSINSLPIGPHSISAVYNKNGSDLNFLSSTSNVLNQQVFGASTTSIGTVTPNPATFGQQVTFNVSVTGPTPTSQTPKGSITFTAGPSTSPILLASGMLLDNSGNLVETVTLPLTVNAGTQTITATYNSTDGFYATSLATFNLTVNPEPTTMILSPASNQTVVGSLPTPNNIIATVAGQSSLQFPITPKGTVTFTATNAQDSTKVFVSQPVAVDSLGQAAFNLNTLDVGTYNITATFTGASNSGGVTTNYATSSASAVSLAVSPAPTGTALTVSPNASAIYSQPVTLTATVNTQGGSTATPTGTINFLDGSTPINPQPIPLVNGMAMFTTSSLNVAGHSLTAQFLPDPDFAPSTSLAGSLTVNKANTSTVVTSSLALPVTGQSVVFTATVSDLTPGTAVPAGSVIFKDGTTVLTKTPITLNSAGVATFSTSKLAFGSHNITAVFTSLGGANGNFNGSTSPVFTQPVAHPTAITALSATPNPFLLAGGASTVTATVSSNFGTAKGTVTFTFNGLSPSSLPQIVSPPITLNGSGKAVLQLATLLGLEPGVYLVSAQYSGSAPTFGPSSFGVPGSDVNKAVSLTVVGPPDHLASKALSGTPGTAISLPIGTIQMLDSNGRLVTNYNSGKGQVTITLDPSSPGATLNGGSSITGTIVNGQLQGLSLKMLPDNPVVVPTVFTLDVTDATTGFTTTISVTLVPPKTRRT